MCVQLRQRTAQQQLDQLRSKLPERFTPWLDWLRSPAARLVRIPIGLLLLIGGMVSFLPLLGIWMLPLGLLLLALDVPLLQNPTTRLIEWLGTVWTLLRRRR